MKEDVLEQIVEDYLQLNGYFTRHNVKFRPRTDHPDYSTRQDSVPSDVDVIGFNPQLTGTARVFVVSCKSWQSGFDANGLLAELVGDKKNPKRETWRRFREIWVPKRSEALRMTVAALTGEEAFSYRVAVTHLRGDGREWADHPTIQQNLPRCDFGFLTLEEMWGTMVERLTRTPASSEIGRLAQLLKAAGLTSDSALVPPGGPVPGSEASQEEQHAIERE